MRGLVWYGKDGSAREEEEEEEEKEERRIAGVEERGSVPLIKVEMSKKSLRDSGICPELRGWGGGGIQRGRM